MFAKVISRRQKSPLARKEITNPIYSNLSKILNTSCLTKRPRQTAKAQIRLLFCRAGRYNRDTGISRYFISVIRIVIQFGCIAIFSSLFIVTISCWNLS